MAKRRRLSGADCLIIDADGEGFGAECGPSYAERMNYEYERLPIWWTFVHGDGSTHSYGDGDTGDNSRNMPWCGLFYQKQDYGDYR